MSDTTAAFEDCEIILASSIDPETRTIGIDADVALPYADCVGAVVVPDGSEPDTGPGHPRQAPKRTSH